VAQRGLGTLLDGLWKHAARVVAEEIAASEDEPEPWKP